MPRRVIYVPTREIQAGYKYEGAQAVARGVQDTAAIFAGALAQYHDQKKKEDASRLTLTSALVEQYGDKAGQPLLEDYDKSLKKYGIGGLPRDATGKIVGPPAKNLEQLILREAEKDPKALAAVTQKKLYGIGPLEQQFKAAEREQKERFHRDDMRIKEMNAAANFARAKATSLRGLKDDAFPGIALTKTGELKSYTDPSQLADDERPLTVRDARAHTNRILAAQLGPIRAATVKLKESEIAAKEMEIFNDLTFGAGNKFLPYFKAKAAGTIPKNIEKMIDKRLERFWNDHDIKVEEIPSWTQRFKDFYHSVQGEKFFGIVEAENAAKGVEPGPEPPAKAPKKGEQNLFGIEGFTAEGQE